MPTLVCAKKEIELSGECILGRHRASGLQVKDDAASRQHAKVFVADGLWWVEDLGSANGTSLNGTWITTRKRLRNRDQIGIGQHRITFSDDADGASAIVAVSPPPSADASADINGLVGRTIAGYRVDMYLGRGMLGAVYRAQQLNLDRPVAFKVFDPQRCVRDARLAKRFLAEAGKVGSVTDDGLVQLHESGESDGLLWCSMEWAEGETLEKLMQRGDVVAPELALLIVDKVAAALAVAHAHGVIHGDLRPSHIIVMTDGRIKLTDVGMMGIFEEGELPADGPANVAWYLSPEEAAEGASDPRSDVYSLGCLMFHLLTGQPPFNGANTGAVIAAHIAEQIPSLTKAKLPARLEVAKLDILMQGMLAKNPEWRQATLAEVITDLRPIRERFMDISGSAEAKPSLRRSSEIRTPAAAAAKKSSSPWWLLPLLAIAAVALTGVALAPYLQEKPQPQALPEPDIADVPPPERKPVAGTKPGAGSKQTPSGTPAPVVQKTHPVTTTGKPPAVLAETWTQVQAAVDQSQAHREWSLAEQALAAFSSEIASQKADPTLVRAVAARQQQLASQGDQWYQQTLSQVPKGDAAVDLAKRLHAVDVLRDTALAENRPDAESRYQEALTKLGQRLNAAKRQARQALESGRVLELPKIANDLAPAFATTPVTDLHRQFSLLCNEAAGTKPMWTSTWAVTKPKLLAAKGADALAAAAALLLAGDTAEAKALLANDPALATGELLRRREAIFGRKAAVLTFDDPDDLQYIEVLTGNPRMSGGTLTGAPGEAVGVACAAPLGASGWDVAVGMILEQALVEGQAVISLGHGDTAEAQARFEKDAVYVRVRAESGWQEVRFARPESKVLRLRLAERAGAVSVLLNDQVMLQVPAAKIAVGSGLRFEASGMVWSLTDLQVVGGE